MLPSSTVQGGCTTLPPMNAKTKRHTDLREACLREALAIIESKGVEELSLREVARRLGVSHQAPYKHFPSRDHILAEIVARAFATFAERMDARPAKADPGEDLLAMSRIYLDFAKAHPLQYRLMFSTPLPDTQDHPQMMANARHAFALLSGALQRLAEKPEDLPPDAEVLLDSLFIWSALHGLAGISGGNALKELRFPPEVAAKASDHLLKRIALALGKTRKTR